MKICKDIIISSKVQTKFNFIYIGSYQFTCLVHFSIFVWFFCVLDFILWIKLKLKRKIAKPGKAAYFEQYKFNMGRSCFVQLEIFIIFHDLQMTRKKFPYKTIHNIHNIDITRSFSSSINIIFTPEIGFTVNKIKSAIFRGALIYKENNIQRLMRLFMLRRLFKMETSVDADRDTWNKSRTRPVAQTLFVVILSGFSNIIRFAVLQISTIFWN